jgi:hypothetical protein
MALTFTQGKDYVEMTGTKRSIQVSKVSLGSGKSCHPRIRRRSVSYVNRFNTLGSAEVVTEIRAIRGDDSFQIRVAKRGIDGEPEVVFSRMTSAQGALGHILEDLKTGNHRLYLAESPGRHSGRTSKLSNKENTISWHAEYLEFSDGVSLLLRGLERLTGVSLDSKFVDMGRNVGCRTNFPTLEKVVHGQASRHVRVRRPNGSKSFASGMPTDSAGGAKLPSLKEQIGRNMQAARRNLEWAEEALEQGNPEDAEYRFDTACEYETKATSARSVLYERAKILRERVEMARAAKAAKKAVRDAENAA